MTDYISKIYSLLKRLSLVVVLFSLSRLFFYFFNISLFSELGFWNLIWLFIVGIRFDLSVIIYFNILVILLYLIPVGKVFNSKIYQSIINFIFISVNTILLSVNLSDSVFFHFTQKRSTIDVVKFIFISDDIMDLVPKFISDYWFVSIIIIFIAFALSIPILIKRKKPKVVALSFKSFFIQFTLMILFLGLCIIGGRGGLQLRPLSIIHATAHADAKLSPLILNTPFTLMTTYGHEGIVDRNYFDSETIKTHYNLLKKPNLENEFKEKNIVIILLESFSKEYVGSMNNYKGYTPFLDSLMKKSLVFTNAFSNGYRSLDAIPAAVTSIPCLMDDPIITSVYSNNSYTTLPNLLREKNYYSAFFHGGTNGTLGLDGFAKLLGFQDYFGRTEYNNDEDFDNYWGIYDEPFLEFMTKKLDEFPQPFFAMEFTLSSHYPYSLPQKYVNTFKEGPLKIHRVVRYTDNALNEFFELAKTKEWFKNTIFIISADHPAQSVIPSESDNIFENDNLPSTEKLQYYKNTSGRYSIPFLIYSPGDSLFIGENDNTIQQADIMPTVLSYLNYDKPYYAFGNNIIDTNVIHAAFHYVNGLYQITVDDYCLLFDGEKSVSLFSKSDINHENNILSKETDVALRLENIIKAYIEEYSNRMIKNRMVYKLEHQ